MAFSKKKVEDRKRWLSAYQPGTFLDQSVDTISYKDFVHKVRGGGGGGGGAVSVNRAAESETPLQFFCHCITP